jgi:Ca2+/H+ antiporter
MLPDVLECLLMSEDAVPVNMAASKKAVTYHAFAKQKNADRQGDQEQETSNSEPAQLSSFRGFLIRILCHLSYLSAKSSDCLDTTVEQLTSMQDFA